MPHYDIAIIGAGPSGCTSALALHGSGLKVVLIDKDDFPRDKICGDAIPGPAFKVLDKINPTWGKALRSFAQQEVIKSSKGFAPNGRTITFDWKAFATNSKRLDFDHFLFDMVSRQTDTTIITGKRLKHVEEDAEGIECHLDDNTTLNALLVIGCDGANSVVARELNKDDFVKKSANAAVRAYYKNVSGLESGVNEFHFFKEINPGYFWIFPLADGWINVGLGIVNDRKNAKESQQNLRKTLEEVISSFPTIAPRFESAQLMDKIKGFALPLSTEKRKLSGNRLMLCGDAAALVSPLWGHGIDTGMWSGLYAAEQAKKCFTEGDFSEHFMFQYDELIHQKITKDFIRSAKVLRLIQRFPWILSGFWSLLRFEKMLKWIGRGKF